MFECIYLWIPDSLCEVRSWKDPYHDIINKHFPTSSQYLSSHTLDKRLGEEVENTSSDNFKEWATLIFNESESKLLLCLLFFVKTCFSGNQSQVSWMVWEKTSSRVHLRHFLGKHRLKEPRPFINWIGTPLTSSKSRVTVIRTAQWFLMLSRLHDLALTLKHSVALSI